MDEIDDQGPATNVMHGRVLLFLRRNYFLVQLCGRQVVAAMPEHLLAEGAKLKDLRGRKVAVTGWLYYEPDAESEDPRGTRWEIHPVTSIAVL